VQKDVGRGVGTCADFYAMLFDVAAKGGKSPFSFRVCHIFASCFVNQRWQMGVAAKTERGVTFTSVVC